MTVTAEAEQITVALLPQNDPHGGIQARGLRLMGIHPMRGPVHHRGLHLPVSWVGGHHVVVVPDVLNRLAEPAPLIHRRVIHNGHDAVGYVATDLESVKVNKRTYDDDYEVGPPSHVESPVSDLDKIHDRTGIPPGELWNMQKKSGSLVLRGAELGFINERGQFQVLISAGDDSGVS